MSDRPYTTANSMLQAASELQLPHTAFRQLPGFRAREVLDHTLRTFTVGGPSSLASARRPFVWSDLRDPCAAYSAPRHLGVLLGLGPPDLPIWLLVEDFDGSGSGPPLWVFEATLAAAIATLENHHLLEFYLVSRTSEGRGAGAGAGPWLVCETHHDVIIGVGDYAIAVLDAVCTRCR